jgi:N-acetylglucosamine kinase-like BadF-type ATPase
MTRYFLGVDIGGTKSHALVADEQGKALGRGLGGPGNYEMVGWQGLVDVLQVITGEALAQAGITAGGLAGAGFGIAGYDWPGEYQSMLESVQTLAITAPLSIVNDAVIGLLAGAVQGWGVALVAGTSNNCRGIDQQDREGRIVGEGNPFGEFGGGETVVERAVHAIAAEWAWRGPETTLSSAFVQLTGAKDVSDLLEGLSLRQYELDAQAALVVFEQARQGDQVAQQIVKWTGQQLGDLACGVIRQLQFEDSDFDLVLAGSLFHGGEMLIQSLRETVHAVAPGANFVQLTAPPVVGAVLLGMNQAGGYTTAVRQTLINTTQELFKTSHG